MQAREGALCRPPAVCASVRATRTWRPRACCPALSSVCVRSAPIRRRAKPTDGISFFWCSAAGGLQTQGEAARSQGWGSSQQCALLMPPTR